LSWISIGRRLKKRKNPSFSHYSNLIPVELEIVNYKIKTTKKGVTRNKLKDEAMGHESRWDRELKNGHFAHAE
jgi:hypothetical protein